jgi:sensor histidine kinase YesM
MLAGFFAGLMVWLLAEVLLNIQYRYFVLFTDLLKYLQSAAFGILLMEIMLRMNRLLEKWAPWDQNPGKRLLFQTLSGLMVAFLLVFALRMLVNLVFFPSRLIIFSDEVTILVVVFIFTVFLNLADLGFFLNERYRRSLGEMERFRKEIAENQFEMLKLQLNPHFLFNSLNTLSSLVYEDAGKASDFVRKLSEVYRYVLDNRNRELVSLAEEMDFIRSFTYLLGIRFMGMVEFRLEVDENDLVKQIAPMTLQLLVENAVKHNVASRQKPLVIRIFSGRSYIKVTNNFQPKADQKQGGVGLKNITSRYAFLTDSKVTIRNDENIFEVTIPLL